jgi:polyhydroxyalkanoate synthesis regulator phasin
VSSPRTEGPRPVTEFLLAGVGLASLGREVADELADDLARRIGMERDAMRAAVRDTLDAWRAEAERLGARRDQVVERSFQKAGVARREELEDLELRVAQLEHRLRLLEDDGAAR